MRLRRPIDQKVIDDLHATIAAQQTEIDQLTRTVAALRLIAQAIVRRPGIETR